MGIPSYYKKLVDTIPSLLTSHHPNEKINWLFMDFNCLIYHCLHSPQFTSLNLVYTFETAEEWEAQFLECIEQYCLKVINDVKPQKGVYIAVDGVVPMAKMRQQRLRRFKSIWLQKNAVIDNGGGAAQTWDTNSITPGTHFMKKLTTRLQQMISKHGNGNGKKSWKLSSSDEPGEGEHKIIAEWRKGTYKGDFAVYGLDADLIILTILGRETVSLNNNIWLFREEMTAGKLTYNDFGEEVFEWFSINALQDWLVSDFESPLEKRGFILNYCFAMSVLGNDFLPSSLGLKIRDDGHSELLDILHGLANKHIQLIDPTTLQIQNTEALFNILALNESDRIQKYITKKLMFSRNLGNDAVRNMKLGDNNWPLFKVEEQVLMSGKYLANNWKELYLSNFFSEIPNMGYEYKLCREYLYGIQWIWAYYNGKSDTVCFNWFYPYNLPPLWEWITHYLKKNRLPPFPEQVLINASDIRPVEQLAVVLPLESWHLLPPSPERHLPTVAPQFYPQTFSFETVGKRFFWECESLIPLPSILEVKRIISRVRLR